MCMHPSTCIVLRQNQLKVMVCGIQYGIRGFCQASEHPEKKELKEKISTHALIYMHAHKHIHFVKTEQVMYTFLSNPNFQM